MSYYQEVSLLPNADISTYFLWQKVCPQIHIALVENKNTKNASRIGVGFPGYDADKFSLGTKLRLFAEDKQVLEQVNCEKWFCRLSDYLHVSQIKPVPKEIKGYACFKHIKLKGSKEKLARRRAKRTGETLQQALEYFAGYTEQRSKLPYINMISKTTGQRFRLLIEKLEMEQPKTGTYSCYGLSSQTTVPIF